MKVDLDLDEMFYLLEACLRGSHLRSMTIRRFVDEWYGLFTTKQRCELYKWILRLIYNDDFKPLPRCCGQDIVFMARYNPDNQYRVTVSDGTKTETVEAFKLDGRYWVKSNRWCEDKYITDIEKI